MDGAGPWWPFTVRWMRGIRCLIFAGFTLKTSKNQAEVTEAVASMTARVQADYEGKVVFRLCSDRGKEFGNKTLHHYALQQGLWCTTTEGSDPRANGLAERHVGLIKEKACAMLLDSGLAVGFWPWAMLHAPYILRKHAKGETLPQDMPCFGARNCCAPEEKRKR